MTAPAFAAAQSISIAGDVRANLVRHQHFMQAAAEQGVQLLVFPELSLTGYERGLAAVITRQVANGWTGQVVPVAVF